MVRVEELLAMPCWITIRVTAKDTHPSWVKGETAKRHPLREHREPRPVLPSFSPGEAPVSSDLHNTLSALSAHNLVRSALSSALFSQNGVAALPFCVLSAVKDDIAREQRQDFVVHTLIAYEATRGQAQVHNCKVYERRPFDNRTIGAKAGARNDAGDSPCNPSPSST